MRTASWLATDPRGPWLRSGFCCPTPSSLTTTPSADLAGTGPFRGLSAYRSRLRCAGAPRRPARPSLLSLLPFPRVPPTLRRWTPARPRYHPSCQDVRLPPFIRESPSTSPPLPAIPGGCLFRRCIVRFMLRPARLPSPPDRLQREEDAISVPPPSEVPCHPRFYRRRSPADGGNQATWLNGKFAMIGTFTRQVAAGSEAAR